MRRRIRAAHSTVLTAVDQLDAARLDAILRRSGALTAGAVAHIAVRPVRGDTARLVAIRVRYAPESTGVLPPRLLLKMCAGDDGGGSFGPSEVEYYTRDYDGLRGAPLPRCYDAAYDAQHRRYHLLLDDLSATHRPNWDVPPTRAYGEAVAEALAALHAYRWGEDRWHPLGASVPDTGRIDRYLAHVLPGLRPMLDAGAGDIDPSWPAALATIVERHPPLLRARVGWPHGFTLVHGDVNPGNVLSPRAGAGPTYLIDRQPFDWSLTTWLGVSDVAYLMVHWWDTALRRRFEIPVLRRYHDGLARRDVTSYPWERLLDDYRLCAVQSLYVAMAWCADDDTRQAMRWVWLPQLRKAMVAFSDLRCDELWA